MRNRPGSGRQIDLEEYKTLIAEKGPKYLVTEEEVDQAFRLGEEVCRFLYS